MRASLLVSDARRIINHGGAFALIAFDQRIKKIVNDDSIPEDKKRGFKRRIEKRLKKKDYIESEILCPKCHEENLKYKKYNRTDTKIYKCENCNHIMID